MDAPIDLDHNATTPVDPEVIEAMRPVWLRGGNPESRHSLGRGARRSLLAATESVARILNAHPDEVLFTSGGTEANNLAILGQARPALDRAPAPGRIVVSPIEHPAVSEPIAHLERLGFAVVRPPVSSEGLADAPLMARAAIGDDTSTPTCLVSLILAHNEIGAIQPVGELAALLAGSSPSIPVHTDAVQAVGRIPVDFKNLGVSTLAASAHKFGGPGGVGVLLVRRDRWNTLDPILRGGGQQKGLRPGTVPVALAVGLATALERWERASFDRAARWERLRDRLEAGLIAALGADRVVRNGPEGREKRLPQTLNVAFPGVDGESLLMQLDLGGVRASLGSACASGSLQSSPTLLAMGLPADRLRSSARFSLGIETSEPEIDEAIRRIARVVSRLEASP